MFHVPEKYRCTTGPLASNARDGNNGLFFLPPDRIQRKEQMVLRCIASDGTDWEAIGYAKPAWEHVSVSTPIRCPTWEEMCRVKSIFWDDEDTVIQLHPPKSQWINCHQYCLHLWRPIGVEIPRPPNETVGPSVGKPLDYPVESR